MKNPAIHIKKKLFALLNGAVTYNSQSVYVEEGNGKNGIPYQILIREYSDSDRRDKSNFRYNATQVIEIVNERNNEASKDADAIAGIVMNILQPSPQSDSTLNSSEFQVMIIGTPSKNLLRETDGAGVTVRRILRYQFLVIER